MPAASCERGGRVQTGVATSMHVEMRRTLVFVSHVPHRHTQGDLHCTVYGRSLLASKAIRRCTREIPHESLFSKGTTRSSADEVERRRWIPGGGDTRVRGRNQSNTEMDGRGRGMESKVRRCPRDVTRRAAFPEKRCVPSDPRWSSFSR